MRLAPRVLEIASHSGKLLITESRRIECGRVQADAARWFASIAAAQPKGNTGMRRFLFAALICFLLAQGYQASRAKATEVTNQPQTPSGASTANGNDELELKPDTEKQKPKSNLERFAPYSPFATVIAALIAASWPSLILGLITEPLFGANEPVSDFSGTRNFTNHLSASEIKTVQQ